MGAVAHRGPAGPCAALQIMRILGGAERMKKRLSNSVKVYNRTKQTARKGTVRNNKTSKIYLRFDCLYCMGSFWDFEFDEKVDLNAGFLWVFQHLINKGEIKMVEPGKWMCSEHIHRFYDNLGITTA